MQFKITPESRPRRAIRASALAILVAATCAWPRGALSAPDSSAPFSLAKAPARDAVLAAPAASPLPQPLPMGTAQAASFGAERAMRASVKLENRSRATGQRTWSGTGFFVEGSELALTNNHVASGAALSPGENKLVAIFSDGSEAEAKIVAIDAAVDLAALRVSKPPQARLRLREAPARLGEPVASAGYGLSLQFSISQGLVAALSETDDIAPRLQLSAASDGGVSGGPTVDAAGLAVGVNVAGAGRGVALSIPAASASKFLARASAEEASGRELWRRGSAGAKEEYKAQVAGAGSRQLAALWSQPRKSRLGPWRVALPKGVGWTCADGGSGSDWYDDLSGWLSESEGEPRAWQARSETINCRVRSAGIAVGSRQIGRAWEYSVATTRPRLTDMNSAWVKWIGPLLDDRLRGLVGGRQCAVSPFKEGKLVGQALSCVWPARGSEGLWSGAHSLWVSARGTPDALALRVEFEAVSEADARMAARLLARSAKLESEEEANP